jgi:D-alanyl-D-alanine carboxypeptidase
MRNSSLNEQLQTIHRQLGIAEDYARTCGMPSQPECSNLVAVAPDVFGRPALLEQQTAAAWQSMQAAAAAAGLTLQLVSAYRSYDYQHQLFQRKLERGLSIADILQVNAAPGFSEHHSGCAIDLGCPDFPPLEEVFDQSPAFHWLTQHAGTFGFRMSFPRDNPYGVMYEPWHWYFIGATSR